MTKIDIANTAVVGAGLMGHGIAQVLAVAGFKVGLTDISADALRIARVGIKRNIDDLTKHKIITKNQGKEAIARISMTQKIDEAAKDADFVIEAINEKLDLKRSTFKKLEEITKPETILATNSSTIGISDLATVLQKRDRLLGMHWWNPPHLMRLIEVIVGPETSKSAVDFAINLAKDLGKVPVICKDLPGFLGPRMQGALVLEALRMLDEGVASPEDIDKAAMYTLGTRLPIMGPLQLMDFGGAHIFLHAFEYLQTKLGDRFSPPRILKDNVEQKKLGVMSGQGIYHYTPRQREIAIRQRDEWLFQKLREAAKQKKKPASSK